MKRIHVSLLSFTLAMATTGLVCAADITGTWKAEFDTQIGLQKYVYDFQQDGERIIGRARFDIGGEIRDIELRDVRLKDDEVTFFETFQFQGNQIRIDCRGKLAGDEIKFTRQVGDFATEQLVANRAAAASATAGTTAAAGGQTVKGGERVVRLYDGPAPGSENWTHAEKESQTNLWRTRVAYNVVNPTLTIFPADPARANGTAVVICPGGAFFALSMDSEGSEVARWLTERGSHRIRAQVSAGRVQDR